MHRLALMLLLAAGPLAGAVNTDSVYEDAYAKYTAWSYACELTRLCDGSLTPPKVVFEAMEENYRGYYDGSDTIFINEKLGPGIDRLSTLIHEMIHYQHTKRDLITVPASAFIRGQMEALCWSENQAFTLVDRWLDDQGYGMLKRGPLWWKPYWHCEPYFDPNWNLWTWLSRRFG